MKKSLEKLAEIYSDSKLSPEEFIEFRTLSERAMVNLLSIDGDEGFSNALCKSFEVTNQLLQSTLLKAKRDKENKALKDALADVVFSQMELLKANAALFAG